MDLIYENSLVSANNAPVKVVASQEKGRGVVSLNDVPAGQAIWSEKPLFSIQDSSSKADQFTARACGNCLKFLGTPKDQLAWFKFLLGMAKVDPLENFIQCPNGCGEMFCSIECVEEGMARHHRVLCVGPLHEKHPLVLFKQFAVEETDLFLLAAKVVAVILFYLNSTNGNFQTSMLPISKLHRRRWQDVLSFGELTEADVAKKLTGSYELLLSGLMTSPSVTKQEQVWLSQFFTLDFYLALFGMFDLNSQSIVIPSTLQLYWEEIQSGSKTQRDPNLFPTINELKKIAANLEALKKQHDDDDDEEEGDEDMMDEDSNGPLFESVQGIAIFALESLTNHSCVPNSRVFYDVDHTMTIKTLTNLPANTEIEHSYIEESWPFEDRQEELKVYGFQCRCAKCHQRQ